jgi:hypothetical protein
MPIVNPTQLTVEVNRALNHTLVTENVLQKQRYSEIRCDADFVLHRHVVLPGTATDPVQPLIVPVLETRI